MTSQRRARRRDVRLVPVALSAWAAAGAATALPTVAGWLSILCWLLAAAAVGAAMRARARRAVTVWAVTAVCAAAAAAVATHVCVAAGSRDVDDLSLGGGRVVEYTASVVGKVEPSATGVRFDAIVDSAQVGDAAVALQLPVVVRAASAAPGLDLGARVRVTGTVRDSPVGARAVVTVQARAVEVIAPPQGAFAVASALRNGLQDQAAGLPQPGAGLVAGLAVGDTSAVSDELDAAMKASSLSHLTAVSGANCALVVGIAFALAAAAGAPRAMRAVAGIAALVAFIVLVSPEPSVVRAGAMAAIAMLGVLLGRIGAGVSTLTAAVSVLLVIDPWLAGSIGFALSAAATGALLLLAGPLADGFGRVMPAPLALGLSVPLAAQLACGPLLILIEPSVPVYGVIANLLAAPAAAPATVIGLLACVLAGVPVVGAGLAAVAWVPAAWIAGTAETFASAPWSAAPWIEGLAGAAALGGVGAAVCMLILPVGRRWRATGAVIVTVVAGVAVGAGPLDRVTTALSTPGDWAIVACDVGQGDAVLVRSAGAVALIDAGPDPDALARCLDRFGVDRIEVFVLTHFDLDHRGGVRALVGRVDTVLHPPPDDDGDEALRALEAGGARTVAATAGMSGRLGDAHWRVLWPRAGSGAWAAGNDGSVVIDIGGGGVPPTVLLGDLSAAPQHALRGSGLLAGRYAVVKVAHHGSADQAPALYRDVGPALALVTVGAENTFGHPRDEILDVLRGLGTAIARTDTDGAIAVSTDDDGLRVWRERAAGDVGAPR